MIGKIFNVIRRNSEIYFNSKLSSLIMVLGPLILILIISTLLQNTSLKNIEAGLYFSGEGQYKDNFIEKLNERNFITEVETTLEECKDDVINEVNHVCIHLKKVESNVNSYSQYDTYDVDIYVDFSKQRIVWSIINTVQGIVNEESDTTRNSQINDIKSGSENLESKLSEIDSQLYTASLIVESLKNKASVSISELNNLRTTITSSQGILRGIRDSGALAEPYSSQLSQVIFNLDSSNEKLNTIGGGITSDSELNNIGNGIAETRGSVTELREELDKLQVINNDRLIDPIVLAYYSASNGNIEGSVDRELGQLDYIFPSFLIFFLLLGSLLLSAIMVIRERKSNSYIRNTISVKNGFVFILGNFLTVFLIVLIQFSIIILIGNLFLGINIFSNIYSVLGIVIISIFIFSLIGIALGYIFNSYESATTASAFIALLFFLFSSTIIPSETLPNIFSEIIRRSPLTLLETKMRVALIFNNVLKFNLIEMFSLGLIFVILSLATFIFYKKSKEKEI